MKSLFTTEWYRRTTYTVGSSLVRFSQQWRIKVHKLRRKIERYKRQDTKQISVPMFWKYARLHSPTQTEYSSWKRHKIQYEIRICPTFTPECSDHRWENRHCAYQWSFRLF